MNISILSVFPELYDSFLQTSLIKRAQDNDIVSFDVQSFFSYVKPKERIDAPTCGPGAGMLIRPDVVEKAVNDAEGKHGRAFKIFFSPQGAKLDQKKVRSLAKTLRKQKHVMLIPARYEGMDARVEQYYADEILSVGDCVLMGGDIPAMMMLEAVLRLVPGVVGKQESVTEDSFTSAFVDYPAYTLPVTWQGMDVPDVVRSGNHGAIAQWRNESAAHASVLRHFDWVRSAVLSDDEKKLVNANMPDHYVVLAHSDVLIGPEKKPGTTSVTSIDLHDIARSSKTYGIKKFFVATPLKDQQKIVQTLLDFWQKGVGIEYNKQRYQAVQSVEIKNSVDDAIAAIRASHGVDPILVGTSAREVAHAKPVTFFDHTQVWQHERPVLFVFGTGKGLTQDIMERCDYILPPVEGLSGYKHLSVRSAVAIILDRWLGLNRKNG